LHFVHAPIMSFRRPGCNQRRGKSELSEQSGPDIDPS
jgi:hypothetical protein